jgi:hypothetical protein
VEHRSDDVLTGLINYCIIYASPNSVGKICIASNGVTAVVHESGRLRET